MINFSNSFQKYFYFISTVFTGSIVILNCFIFPTSTYAQQSAIQISPTSLEIELEPGKAYQTQEFQIFNPSRTNTQKINTKSLDFYVANEAGTYTFSTNQHGRYSLSEWTTLEPESFTLEPLETQILRVTVKPPITAEPGGHYTIILASARPLNERELQGVSVKSTGGVGAPIFATIPGDISWAGRIIEFLPVPFKNIGPVQFKIRFENQGTVHYKPHGKIEIFDFLNNKVGEVEIDRTRTFPKTIRRITAKWDRYLLIGKYRAKATLNYGEAGKEKTETAEITFWGFPYKAAAVILVTVIVLIGFSKLRKKQEESRKNR